MKKYKTIFDEKQRLYRIEALRDFCDVKKGQLGGFIAKEENLSHEGNCWVYGEAEVWGDACIYENAKIYDQVKVHENAHVHGEAQIYHRSRIAGNTNIYGKAIIDGDSRIYDNAKVYDNAHIYSSFVCGSAQIFEKAILHYGAYVEEQAQIKGDVVVLGLAEIFGDAVVAKRGDYLVLHKWWSEQCQYITWTRSNGKYIDQSFYGTEEEFIEHGNKDNVIFNYAYKQMVEYVNKITEIEL